MKAPPTYPKTLVLSFSGIGSPNATGQLLQLLFDDWPSAALLQVYFGHHPQQGITAINLANHSVTQVLDACREFAPELIYFRPTDNHSAYFDCAMTILDAVEAPLVTHIMDDWPARLGPGTHDLIDALRAAFARSALRLTICREMSQAYSTRYGYPFDELANGIDTSLWENPTPRQRADERFKIRYAGALADDMQRQSITDIAQAVASLQTRHPVDLEIYTMPWFRSIADDLAKKPGVSAHDLVPIEEYPGLLASADAVVLAYNFDPRSIEYTKLSFANKTPECLASGAPILAYGPPDVPSISHLITNELATVVDKRNKELLVQAIDSIIGEPSRARDRAQRAKRFALEHHSAKTVREKFVQMMSNTAHAHSTSDDFVIKRFSREDDVSIDETDVVFEYFAGHSPGVMIDVGAHHGSAFKSFLDAEWTVHGFEPDPENRKFITDRHSATANLTVNPNAVSNVSGEKLPFFASEQSTGISSLIPFHEGHKQVATIETITLKDYFEQHNIDHVDFLKIDTEGYDLRVLEGVDWDRCRPRVIECEFEDAKTTKIGYDFHDLARYLIDLGYTVYVSEWHPIVRYGIRHQWHALHEYPCELDNPSSWGNLLAFTQEAAPANMAALFLAVLARRNPDKSLTAPSKDVTQDSPISSQHTLPAEHSPMSPLSNHLRIFKQFIASVPGRLTMLGGLLILGVNSLPALFDASETNAMTWAALATSFAIGIYLVAYLRERILFEAQQATAPQPNRLQKLQKDSRALRQDLAALRQLINQETTKLGRRLDETSSAVAHQAEQDVTQDLKQEISQLTKILEASEKQIATLQGQLDTHSRELLEMQQRYVDLKGKLPGIVQMINNVRKETSAA